MSRAVASADGNDALLPREDRASVFKELLAILKIAIPIFMAMVSWVAMKVPNDRHIYDLDIWLCNMCML